MLKVLLQKQMMEIFRSYFYDAKKNRKRSKAAAIGYMVFFVVIMAGVLGGMFTYLSMALCADLAEAGMGWLYFTLMGLLAIFLGTFGSVFNTYSGLYLARDNDLLLSLPIPVRTIMAARLLGVYLLGLMYSAVVIVPAVIVYWITVPITAAAAAGSVLLVFLISVFVLTLSCILGWVVAKVSLRLKNKSFITVIVSLLFLAAYYFFYFKAQELISDLVANAAVYGGKIKGAAYPLYLFGRIGQGDGMAMLLISAAVLAAFAVVWFVLSRSFLRIATSSGKTAKVKYRETASKQRSISDALLRKEFGRFTASPNYMLNCGLGILFLPVCGVLLLVKGEFLVSLMSEIFRDRADCIPVLACAGVCMLASMNDMAEPSVSLEGKNLWLAQSLPVTPWQVLCAKLSVQLILTGVPVLFFMICAALILPCTPVQLLLAAAAAVLYVIFSALFGLFLGLKMPNLTWTNEIAPIKQSMGAMLAMLGGWIYAIAMGGGFLLGGWRIGAVLYLGAFALGTLLLSALLYMWLKKSGTEIFAAL